MSADQLFAALCNRKSPNKAAATAGVALMNLVSPGCDPYMALAITSAARYKGLPKDSAIEQLRSLPRVLTKRQASADGYGLGVSA